jgi:hypothetical protein
MSPSLRITHHCILLAALVCSLILSFDATGDLFGTTLGGGSGTSCINGCGTVFEILP